MKERPQALISKGNYSQNNGNRLEILSGTVMVLVYHNVCYQCLKCKDDGFYSMEVMVQKKKNSK